MLPIAALILTDNTDARFEGVDLNERAALVARSAGIGVVFFVGERLPDLVTIGRLRARGVSATNLLGWPRLFAGVPPTGVLVVLPARTVLEPEALKMIVRDAAADHDRAALVVDQGPQRRNSIIRVAAGRVTSVIGDGNAMSTGVIVIPGGLLPRIRTVWSLRDAVHRLAKTGDLRALTVAPLFCRSIHVQADVAEVEREYARHIRPIEWQGLFGRIVRLPKLAFGALGHATSH